MKGIKKLVFAFTGLMILSTSSFAQVKDSSLFKKTETIYEKEFEANLDSVLNSFFASKYLKIHQQSFLMSTEEEDRNDIPVYPDSVYMQRLGNLPNVINLPYNEHVRSFIELYVNKKRKSVKVMLGLAQYYFPIFEEILDKTGVPQELKYLAVIESALNPKAVSGVGATGLWQFMYTTGKMYDLKINSLVDERRDPIKSSYAAARYLKDLYTIYKDWTLAIAAYNCGPGNVNKAIKRSGGKNDFWEIYPYLPQETRGYVPAFIAANYMMNYYKEHNLFPSGDAFPVLTDTVMVNEDLHLEQVSSVLNIPIKQLRELNPQYKNDIIPGKSEAYSLKLPVNMITSFIEYQDSIYSQDSAFFKGMTKGKFVPVASRYGKSSEFKQKIRHVVGKNETISQIATKYGVTVGQIKKWNHLRNTTLKKGKLLVIYYSAKEEKIIESEKPESESEKLKETEKPDSGNANQSPKVEVPKGKEKNKTTQKEVKEGKKSKTKELSKAKTKTHKIKPGESLYSIAQKYGVTEDELAKFNNIKNKKKINAGQTLNVPQN